MGLRIGDRDDSGEGARFLGPRVGGTQICGDEGRLPANDVVYDYW